MGYTRRAPQGLSGRKAGNMKEVVFGGLTGVEKVVVFDGGK